jgi:hypothetical protein
MSTPDEMTAIFTYLDALHASGIVYMPRAAPYLMEEFDFDEEEARSVLVSWLKSFDPAIPATKRAELVEAV